ncbi:acyl-CoA reductase [Priestia megaterium]
MQRFLIEDLGNLSLLDEFQPRVKGGFSKAIGPDLITHIWSGNVPGLPLWSFISGLLVKSGNIGKVPSAEPLFAGWFARLLVEIEPRLSNCFAVVWWKGGNEERECSLFKQTDVVVGYGGMNHCNLFKVVFPLLLVSCHLDIKSVLESFLDLPRFSQSLAFRTSSSSRCDSL